MYVFKIDDGDCNINAPVGLIFANNKNNKKIAVTINLEL